jgi:hypothetical protein
MIVILDVRRRAREPVFSLVPQADQVQVVLHVLRLEEAYVEESLIGCLESLIGVVEAGLEEAYVEESLIGCLELLVGVVKVIIFSM